jgi:hypothetical protein
MPITGARSCPEGTSLGPCGPQRYWPVLATVSIAAAGLGALLALDEGADEDDPLALLARDPGPVVGVGGVGQVLVLAELVDARGEQVLDPDALLPVSRGGP